MGSKDTSEAERGPQPDGYAGHSARSPALLARAGSTDPPRTARRAADGGEAQRLCQASGSARERGDSLRQRAGADVPPASCRRAPGAGSRARRPRRRAGAGPPRRTPSRAAAARGPRPAARRRPGTPRRGVIWLGRPGQDVAAAGAAVADHDAGPAQVAEDRLEELARQVWRMASVSTDTGAPSSTGRLGQGEQGPDGVVRLRRDVHGSECGPSRRPGRCTRAGRPDAPSGQALSRSGRRPAAGGCRCRPRRTPRRRRCRSRG